MSSLTRRDATLSSTLDVAGDVANGGNAVHGRWRDWDTGNTVVAATLVEHAVEMWHAVDVEVTLSSTWQEVCGDGIGRVAGDFVEQVHGGWQHGQHGGGGDAGRDGSDYVEQPELGSCDAVEHAGCGRRRANSGKFAVTALDGSLAISSNKFTVAGNTGNTVGCGDVDVSGDVTSGEFAVTASEFGDFVELVHGGWRHVGRWWRGRWT